MVHDLTLKNNNMPYQAGNASGPAVSTTSGVTVVPVGQTGNVVGNVNTTATSSSVINPEQPQTKRTIDELYNSISALCQVTGLDLAEAKAMGLLSIISGKAEEDLLNAEQGEINKIIAEIQNAINAIKEDIDAIRNNQKDLSFQLIINYTRLLKGEIPEGWTSVESFRKAQRRGNAPESLAERINRMYGCDITKMSKEALAKKLEAYFYTYLITEQENGKSPEEIKNLQMTDFSKLLFNSSPEEYTMFRDAIDYLITSNRDNAYLAILESFNNVEDKIAFNKSTSPEQIQDWCTQAGTDGIMPTEEDVDNILIATGKYDDAEQKLLKHEYYIKQVEQNYNNYSDIINFIKENPEKVQELINKEEDKLTSDEKRILDVHYSLRFGERALTVEAVSLSNSEYITDDEVKSLANRFQRDLYKLGNDTKSNIYREINNEIAKLVEERSEELNISKEDFEKLMNEASNGNYSIIINDLKNGTTTALNAPAEVSTATTATVTSHTSESNIGITTRGSAPATNPQEKITTLYQTQPNLPESTDNLTIGYITPENQTPINYSQATLVDAIQEDGIKAFDKYVKENGIKATIVETFQNIDKMPTYFTKSAIKFYKNFKGIQEDVLRNVYSSSVALLLPHTSETVLTKLDSDSFVSFSTEQMIEKAQEEAELTVVYNS